MLGSDDEDPRDRDSARRRGARRRRDVVEDAEAVRRDQQERVRGELACDIGVVEPRRQRA